MEDIEPKNEKEPIEEMGSESASTSDFLEKEKFTQELRDSIKAMTIKVNLNDDSQRENK